MATKTDTLEIVEETTTEAPKAKKPRAPRTPKTTELLVFVEDGQVTTLSENVELIVFNFDRLATAPVDEVEAAFYHACAIKDEPLRQRTAKRVARILNA